jgi:hypothetical protein
MRVRSCRFSPWAIVLGLGLSVLVAGCGEDPKKVNEACSADPDCQDNICHAGICASLTPVPNKASCQGKGDCKSFNCSAGKCVDGVVELKATCRNSEECATNNCDSGVCAPGKAGAVCADDAQCEDAICYEKKCAKKCAGEDDCSKSQDCGTDDGKRLFCKSFKYKSWLGMNCAANRQCPVEAKCIGTVGDAHAICSMECKDDTDCPPALHCDKAGDKSYCLANRFCSTCLHDDNCPDGLKCLDYKGSKFCSSACNKGTTECPMYAECKDTGKGAYHCIHKSGSCDTTGELCKPCARETDCKQGALCLTFNLTEESFCSSDCTSATCPTGYKCSDLSSGEKQCTPDLGDTTYPTCTSALTMVGNPGDILEDFAIVGVKDTDNDNDLKDEKLEVIKLSDFSDKKIILFNISAFW